MKLKFGQGLLFTTSLLTQAFPSSANTEIINLAPTLGPRIPTTDFTSSNWPILTPTDGQNEHRWSMIHVPHERDADGCIGKGEWCEDDLWLMLDFDAEGWNAYRSFTLRVSWPASVRPGRTVHLLAYPLIHLRTYQLSRFAVSFLHSAPV
jgi:hypothetical protein